MNKVLLLGVFLAVAGSLPVLYADGPEPLWSQGGMIYDVDGLDVSPGGTWWAVAGAEQIRIGRIADGSVTAVLYTPLANLSSILFTADEQRIVVASTVPMPVWNIMSQTVERTLALRDNDRTFRPVDNGRAVAFSPDNTVLATGGKWSEDEAHAIALWDFSTGDLLHSIDNLPAEVLSLDIAHDNSTLVYTLDNGAVVSWDIAQRKPVQSITLAPGRLKYVQCASLGFHVAGITQWQNGKCYVQVYDSRTLDLIRNFETNCSVGRVDFSADGSRLLVPAFLEEESGDVKICAIQSGALLGTIHSVRLYPTHVYSIPNAGTENVVLMEKLNGGIAVDIASLETQQVVRSILPHFTRFAAVEFSPDGRRLAALLDNGRICLYDAASGRLLQEKDVPMTFFKKESSLVFSPDGTLLAVTGDNADIYVWNTEDISKSRMYTGHSDQVLHTAFSSDGAFLASCGLDRSVVITNLQTGAVTDRLQGYDRPLYHVRWAPGDAEIIAVASMEEEVGGGCEIITWNYESGALSRTPNVAPAFVLVKARRVRSSADGRFIVVGLTVWDRLNALGREVETGRGLEDAAITLDGDFISVANMDTGTDTNSNVEIWNIAANERAFSGRIHDAVLYSRNDAHISRRVPLHKFTALSPDGAFVAAGSNDGTLVVWDVRQYTDVGEGGPSFPAVDVSIQPNPVSELLAIHWRTDVPAAVRITLFNAAGTFRQELESLVAAFGDFRREYTVDHLPTGLYYCEIAVNGQRRIVPVAIIH